MVALPDASLGYGLSVHNDNGGGDGSPPFTCVVPAWNEADVLPALLRTLRAELGDIRVIVVDNASSDSTADLAKRLGARTISEPRLGKGFAILAGLAAVDTDIAFCCDADIAGLRGDAIRCLVRQVTAPDVPFARLSLDRPPAAAPVTTLLGRPFVRALGFRCREPLGGIFACRVRYVRELSLPGDWSFDLALTVATLARYGTILEVEAEGITHRVRSVGEYERMAEEVMRFIVAYGEQRVRSASGLVSGA